MYNILYGNVVKKDKNFVSIINDNFKQATMLGELIDITEGFNGQQKMLSPNNAKTIIYGIIDDKFVDGDLSVTQIIEQEVGTLG